MVCIVGSVRLEPCGARVQVKSGSASSTGSGYESDSGGSWGSNSTALLCPTCGSKNSLPAGGVVSLPPHYVLQHRMVLNSLNRETTRLLCDLCSTDIPVSIITRM